MANYCHEHPNKKWDSVACRLMVVNGQCSQCTEAFTKANTEEPVMKMKKDERR